MGEDALNQDDVLRMLVSPQRREAIVEDRRKSAGSEAALARTSRARQVPKIGNLRSKQGNLYRRYWRRTRTAGRKIDDGRPNPFKAKGLESRFVELVKTKSFRGQPTDSFGSKGFGNWHAKLHRSNTSAERTVSKRQVSAIGRPKPRASATGLATKNKGNRRSARPDTEPTGR